MILIYPYFTQLPKAMSSDFMISALTYSSSHLFTDDVQIYVSSPDLWPPEPYFSFFFFLNIFKFLFYLTLQYCIGFAIYQNESATGIHVFSILNPPPSSLPYHPSGWSQCSSPKHPVSCIEPGLVTHFICDILLF